MIMGCNTTNTPETLTGTGQRHKAVMNRSLTYRSAEKYGSALCTHILSNRARASESISNSAAHRSHEPKHCRVPTTPPSETLNLG